MKKFFSFLLMVCFIAPTAFASSELSEERKRELEQIVNLRFIDKAMQKIITHQGELQKFSLKNRRYAVGYASALVADKTPAWLEKQTSKGRFSEQDYYRAVGNMMSFLSSLAADAQMEEAAKCHELESRALNKKAEGGGYISPECRMKAYAHQMASLIQWDKTQEAKPVKKIVDKWVKSVMLASLLMGESNE